jgi:hypothetical protein
MLKSDLKYVQGAAYHEAAHIVIAAVQGLPLGKGGLRIDEQGAGFAEYRCTRPTGSTALGADAYKERTIIATNAGHIAHGMFYPPVANGDANASDDFELIQKLLREMYPTSDIRRDAAQRELLKRSKDLVEQHCESIKVLAEALWAKEWRPQLPVAKWREKRMEGAEVITLLKQRGISAVLDED